MLTRSGVREAGGCSLRAVWGRWQLKWFAHTPIAFRQACSLERGRAKSTSSANKRLNRSTFPMCRGGCADAGRQGLRCGPGGRTRPRRCAGRCSRPSPRARVWTSTPGRYRGRGWPSRHRQGRRRRSSPAGVKSRSREILSRCSHLPTVGRCNWWPTTTGPGARTRSASRPPWGCAAGCAAESRGGRPDRPHHRRDNGPPRWSPWAG